MNAEPCDGENLDNDRTFDAVVAPLEQTETDYIKALNLLVAANISITDVLPVPPESEASSSERPS